MELERRGTLMSVSAEMTRRQAGAFAGKLAKPALVLLSGTLGAGKTEWVKGLVQGMGGDSGQVASPTFALSHGYEVPGGLVHHWDLYRLEVGTDWAQLELWEHVEEQNACTVVEWPERCPEPWPEWAWRVELETSADETRIIRWWGGPA